MANLVGVFWKVKNMSANELREFFNRWIEIEDMAKLVREEWARYAIETLGDKAPAGFTKPWEQTGEWGREGNRRVASCIVNAVITKILESGQEDENKKN